MANKKKAERLKELRGLDAAGLDAAIVDAQKAIYQFRRDRLSKPVSDVKVTKHARKDIARILTIKQQLEAGK